MLKELDQSRFATTIIKDLGMRLKEGTKRKMRYVLLACAECGTHFEKTVDNAIRRQESKCTACTLMKQYPMKVLEWRSTADIQFECNRCGVDFNQSSLSASKHNRYGLCPSCKRADADTSLTTDNLMDKLKYNPESGTLKYTRPLHQTKGDPSDLNLKVRKDGRIQFAGSRNVSKARVCLWLYYGYDVTNGTRPVGFRDKDTSNYCISNLEVGRTTADRSHMPFKYTVEYVTELASTFTLREDFKRAHYKEYGFARSHGWLDTIFTHLPTVPTWTLESAMCEALKFNTREDFKRGCTAAYDILRKKFPEHREEAFAHMEFNSSSDNNAIYLWRVVGLVDVYKIGVTSTRLDDIRISAVAKNAGVASDIIVLKNVSDAKTLESILLGIGTPYSFGRKFNGSTEFRILDTKDFTKVKELIMKAE